MTVGGGFGGGAWGGSPWGGAGSAEIAGNEECDLFIFEGADMQGILTAPYTTPFAGNVSEQFYNFPPPPAAPAGSLSPSGYGLGVYSGDLADSGFPTAVAGVHTIPLAGVPNTWTLEWTVVFERVPLNFNTDANHIYFGGSNDGGPVAGVLVSEQGLAYTGSVHYDGGELVLDAPVTLLPDTAQLVTLGREIVFRLVADGNTGIVLLYATALSDLLVSGHNLVAILPVITAGEVGFPPIDQAVFSVQGTASQPSRMVLERWCMSSTALVTNLPPVAIAGDDQAVRRCAIVRFDGSDSFDPEGVPVTYSWRLIDGPEQEVLITQVHDAATYPVGPPGGFTDKIHSVALGSAHALDPILAGDVINAGGTPVTIVTTGSDGNGFFVLLAQAAVPDGITGGSFKLLRQRGISDSTSAMPTFYPTAVGFYRFDLIVNDGNSNSESSVVSINVVESPLPRGVVPDMGFMFNYLSDFWRMVEDSPRVAVLWSALAQVVSTELYTLWQHEYSKSLRDIQRRFVRRWLHYDLLLGEPVPEFTTVRVVLGGVTSSTMDPLGVAGVEGTTLVISSDALTENATVIIEEADPVTAASLAFELSSKLQDIDSRFSVDVVVRRDSLEEVRIVADFPFTIEAGTSLPIFTVGQVNGALSGTGAIKFGTRSIRLDRSLTGLGLQEDDLLALDGEIFRIASVSDDLLDTYPSQRLTVKRELPANVPSDWFIGSKAASNLLDFYNGLVSLGDSLFLEVASTAGTTSSLLSETELIECVVLGAQETRSAEASAVAFDATPLGAVFVQPNTEIRVAKVVRRTYLPLDALVDDIPTLVEHVVIDDDEATLRRNVDYFLETFRGVSCIRFMSGMTTPYDIWEGELPPDRLWAEYTYIDNSETIESNFGIPAGLTVDQLSVLPDTVDYLSAVRGLWYAYLSGPTLYNLRVGTQILLGLPFAERQGVIEEIRTDFSPNTGRMLIRDTERTEIVRSYTFPESLDVEVNPDTGEQYAVGDTVEQFAPLVEGAEIIDYVKDPVWFQGMFNQGIIYEVEKYHRFMVRVDSAAFDLSALLLAKDFVLNLKPRITYPIFLVRKDLGYTDVDINDEMTAVVSLTLDDSPCGNLFSSHIYDDARPSIGPIAWTFANEANRLSFTPESGTPSVEGDLTGADVGRYALQLDNQTFWTLDSIGPTVWVQNGLGRYWNRFDNRQNEAPATSPVPNVPVDWAYDRYTTCPQDIVQLICCADLDAGPIEYDHCFAYDTPVTERIRTLDNPGPFVVPNGTTGLALTANGTDTVVNTGTLVRARLLIIGGPGVDPTDYELVIAVNAVDQTPEPFTAGVGYTELSTTLAIAVTAADVLTARIRHSDGSPRNPAWTDIRLALDVEGALWTFDDNLPAARYCGVRTIVS